MSRRLRLSWALPGLRPTLPRAGGYPKPILPRDSRRFGGKSPAFDNPRIDFCRRSEYIPKSAFLIFGGTGLGLLIQVALRPATL